MNWDWYGRVADSLGILTVVFSGYAAWKLWRQNKRLRELAQNVPKIENFKQLVEVNEGVKSSAPMALAISLIPSNESIRKTVENFLLAKGYNMEIEELNMNGINSRDDLEEFLNRLREKKRFFDAQGITELHLFIAAPVQAGVLVGGVFDNWIPVKLYHRPQPPPPEFYEYWMPLQK